jgi:hypothetical protein
LLLVALALTMPGCGGGGDDSAAESGDSFAEQTSAEDTSTHQASTSDASTENMQPEAPRAPDQGCEASHPIRLRVEPPDVIACSAVGGLSVHVENVSAHVLLFRPTSLEPPTQMTLDATGVGSAGVEAAHAATGSGWLGDKFVLSTDQSFTATSDALVSLHVERERELTLKALLTQSVVDWLTSRLQTRGQALAQRAQSCATAAERVATGTYVEDIIRSGLETPVCDKLLRDVLAEERVPPWELPRARTQILELAKPVLKDEVVTLATKIVAHR